VDKLQKGLLWKGVGDLQTDRFTHFYKYEMSQGF